MTVHSFKRDGGDGDGGRTIAGWERRERPPSLERRIEFAEYQDTRLFMDALGKLCEETGIYPNQSFGRTYVNLTLFADDGGELTPALLDFAERTEALLRELSGDPT